jgi:hypothetical protein
MARAKSPEKAIMTAIVIAVIILAPAFIALIWVGVIFAMRDEAKGVYDDDTLEFEIKHD